MAKVRLLFAPESVGIAERITHALADAGHEACGVEETVDAALVIWSPAAAASAPILAAARDALARRVLIPVALNKAPPPASFEHLWPMDLAGWGGDADDPRWRFVLDEIDLALRRGVELSPAPPARAGEKSAGKKRGSRLGRRAAEAADDAFASAAAYPVRDAKPRPRGSRLRTTILAGGAAIVVASAFAVARFDLSALTADRKASEAPPRAAPVVAFIEPDETSTEEFVAAETAEDALGDTGGWSDARADEEALPAAAEIIPSEGLREGEILAAIGDGSAAGEGAPPLPASSGVTPAETPAASAAATAEPKLPDAPVPDPALAAAEPTLPPAPDPIAELARETAAEEAPATFGSYFRDCLDCPDMAEIDPGVVTPDASDADATPVILSRRIAVSVRETTFDDWKKCVDAGACTPRPDAGWGQGKRPVVNVSWSEAQAYVAWLSGKTGVRYRLPSESEWEYAARGGSSAAFSFGEAIAPERANYDASRPYNGPSGAARGRTMPTASFSPNRFGLYDMHGNVAEWTADCWTGEAAASASPAADFCAARVVKGGGWSDGGVDLRASARDGEVESVRRNDLGFRVARDVF